MSIPSKRAVQQCQCGQLLEGVHSPGTFAPICTECGKRYRLVDLQDQLGKKHFDAHQISDFEKLFGCEFGVEYQYPSAKQSVGIGPVTLAEIQYDAAGRVTWLTFRGSGAGRKRSKRIHQKWLRCVFSERAALEALLRGYLER